MPEDAQFFGYVDDPPGHRCDAARLPGRRSAAAGAPLRLRPDRVRDPLGAKFDLPRRPRRSALHRAGDPSVLDFFRSIRVRGFSSSRAILESGRLDASRVSHCRRRASHRQSGKGVRPRDRARTLFRSQRFGVRRTRHASSAAPRAEMRGSFSRLRWRAMDGHHGFNDARGRALECRKSRAFRRTGVASRLI